MIRFVHAATRERSAGEAAIVREFSYHQPADAGPAPQMGHDTVRQFEQQQELFGSRAAAWTPFTSRTLFPPPPYGHVHRANINSVPDHSSGALAGEEQLERQRFEPYVAHDPSLGYAALAQRAHLEQNREQHQDATSPALDPLTPPPLGASRERRRTYINAYRSEKIALARPNSAATPDERSPRGANPQRRVSFDPTCTTYFFEEGHSRVSSLKA